MLDRKLTCVCAYMIRKNMYL